MWRDGRTDFGTVRSRASARGRRLADLVHRYPASYAAFDCLAVDGRDLRGRSYLDRRAALLDVLEPLGPPLQAVPATDDIEVARVTVTVVVHTRPRVCLPPGVQGSRKLVLGTTGASRERSLRMHAWSCCCSPRSPHRQQR
ncbi:hypothetical protein ACIREE_38830 [Streptomyces sp. NPDC102467]|uniref:ATP-dependent DNA ligase n=1 Tax=Streptomyces sp. NPDC102467 TaxID=3366179 RepID=UPI0038022609